MLTIECLQQTITSGQASYPVYVGFLSAQAIAQIAEAPSFTPSTPHQQIAVNVTSQPVRDWQRPLDTSRIGGISDTFDNTGHLMPNPILLGQNAFVTGKISISPRTIPGTPSLTGTYDVAIDDSTLTPGSRPLWILDGQHRVAGLAKSKQMLNPVPVVFLLDNGSGAYTSPLLASLFAQVTTSATKLDDLHNEWLTYAFGLDSYRPSLPRSADERQSFETVVELCRAPSYAGHSNPFLNAVQFNEHIPAAPAHGGFNYKCTVLKSLIQRYYYGQPAVKGYVTPADLAEQISLAYSALWSIVGSQADSVFFGPAAKQQSIVQDAYLVGVFARMLQKGPPASWADLLKALAFHQSNWDFSWVRGLSGPANTASKKIAIDVLSAALATGSLPTGSNNIPDHLRGNGANVQLALSALSPNGRPRKAGRLQISVLRGGNTTQPANGLAHLKVTEQSSNVGRLEVVDGTARGRSIPYREISSRGLVLDPASGLPNPLELMFLMTHYGDLHSSAELQVNW